MRRERWVWGSLAASVILCTGSRVQSDPNAPPPAVKVLVIAPSSGEGQPWIDALGMNVAIPVAGLLATDPTVHCNGDGICELTTGVGKANAAASVSAVVLGGQLDLSHAYFLVVGLGAIDPSQGTVGSVVWASYVVDAALSWEIDARSLPAGWSTGYLGFNTTSPTEKPSLQYGTEVYSLDATLTQAAVKLSKAATLEDDDSARALRAMYSGAPATQPPAVMQCDAATADTSWRGELLGARVHAWTSLLTDGAAAYCVSVREDSAVITALQRGGAAGLLDAKRIAVLHAATSFDRPHTGQTPYDSLVNPAAAGFPSATKNLVHAAQPFLGDIVARWSAWEPGVPQ